MNTIRTLLALLMLPFLICCTSESGKGQQKTAQNLNTEKDLQTKNDLSVAHKNDDQEFRKVFKSLTESLKDKNGDQLISCLNFPFYTSHKEAANGMGIAADPVSRAEFGEYKSAIFNADVMRLLPLCKEDNFSEVDEKSGELYYRSLIKLTDPGSKIYEVYMQYPEKGTQAESYFGFVFGRVKGKFKILSTYSKWPVK